MFESTDTVERGNKCVLKTVSGIGLGTKIAFCDSQHPGTEATDKYVVTAILARAYAVNQRVVVQIGGFGIF